MDEIWNDSKLPMVGESDYHRLAGRLSKPGKRPLLSPQCHKDRCEPWRFLGAERWGAAVQPAVYDDHAVRTETMSMA